MFEPVRSAIKYFYNRYKKIGVYVEKGFEQLKDTIINFNKIRLLNSKLSKHFS